MKLRKSINMCKNISEKNESSMVNKKESRCKRFARLILAFITVGGTKAVGPPPNACNSSSIINSQLYFESITPKQGSGSLGYDAIQLPCKDVSTNPVSNAKKVGMYVWFLPKIFPTSNPSEKKKIIFTMKKDITTYFKAYLDYDSASSKAAVKADIPGLASEIIVHPLTPTSIGKWHLLWVELEGSQARMTVVIHDGTTLKHNMLSYTICKKIF